jgi:class 3 adenylate cyclase
MPSVRRLTAILAADVAGYSRLMGVDEEGTHERLKEHLGELVNPKIGEHKGPTNRSSRPVTSSAVKFAVDSLLEEEGFESSVPLVSRGDLPAPVHRHSFRPLRCLRSLEPFVHQREN